ncbi:MAG: DUF1016 N-terminal domain-containing protein [Solirubrobacterales bacterium]
MHQHHRSNPVEVGELRRTPSQPAGRCSANLRHMRAFVQAWPEWEVCSQAVSKLPWGHNLELVYKLDDRRRSQSWEA